MSASYLVDLGNTCVSLPSIVDTPLLSGSLSAVASGAIIGNGVDLLHANSFCNLNVTGVSSSGQLRVAVQCSDSDVSGSYTDPTSGLPVMPTSFSSGGLLWLNSGGAGGGLLGGFVSGQAMASGFSVYAGFQRTARFVRANALLEGSAQFGGSLNVSFVSQLKTTGSGYGYTFSPSSGTVNV